MASNWKKVIYSGSNATVGKLTVDGLKIEDLVTVAAQDTALKPLVVDLGPGQGAGNVMAVTQSTLDTNDTTYFGNNGVLIDTTTSPAHTLNIDYTTISHDDFANIPSDQHQAWEDEVTDQVIHATNYVNTTQAVDGLGYILLNGPDSQNLSYSSSTSQLTWDEVNLTEGDIGASAGSPAHFDIQTTSSIYGFDIDAPAFTASFAQTMVLQGSPDISASSMNLNANLEVGTALDPTGLLQVSGTFAFNGISFEEQVVDFYTGSHTFGSSSANFHQFTGSVQIPQGLTSTMFSGSGTNLTGLGVSNVDFAQLTFGDGIEGVGGGGGAPTTPTFYDYHPAAQINIHINSTASVSGLENTLTGPKITALGVKTVHFSASAVQTAHIDNGHVDTEHLHNQIIDSQTPNLVDTTSGGDNHELWHETSIGYDKRRHLSSIRTAIQNSMNTSLWQSSSSFGGTVTSIGVQTDAATNQDGFRIASSLSSQNYTFTLTPTVGDDGISNGPDIGDTNWSGTGGEGLLIAKGGTGATDSASAAINLFSGNFSTTTTDGGANTLTIGQEGDTIKILGGLETQAPSTTSLQTALKVADNVIELGKDSEGTYVDLAMRFGRISGVSNTLVFDSFVPTQGHKGRLGFAKDFDTTSTTQLTDAASITTYNPIGVHFRNTEFAVASASAYAVDANQDGNMLVDSAGDIYFHV